MTPAKALPAVLDRIDADLDRSLERLFELMRIQSISTDPAFAAQCRAAADFVAGDLRDIGFDTAVASAPFVATLVDVTGLVIYFWVAALILRGTLL